MTTGANGTATNSYDALLTEYQVCNDIVESSSNRCWLAASLFIGAAFAALGILLSAGRLFEPVVPVLGAMFATLTLIGLKRFLINEEWRHAVCYYRMREIERQLNGGMGIITLVRNLTLTPRPARLSWTRLPWNNEFETNPGQHAIKTDVNIRPRIPFGWELLHFSIWLAISAWFLYVVIYFVDWYFLHQTPTCDHPNWLNWLNWGVIVVVTALIILGCKKKWVFGDWGAMPERK